MTTRVLDSASPLTNEAVSREPAYSQGTPTASPDITKPTKPPTRLGDYELLEEIARGGMGVVYRARQHSLDRLVAVKLIRAAGFAVDPAVIQRFQIEARTAGLLQHPGIVPIYEVGQEAGIHYFSMELVTGQDLGQMVRDRPLPPRRAADYLRSVAEAVEYAHAQGILHRDLKPSNVLIDQRDQPRVTDFGLAKRITAAPDGSDLTVSRQVLGTPQYMPPEQIGAKRGAIGPPSDVYAMGAMLYHLLTGRPPFQAASVEDVLLQVIDGQPVSPRQLSPEVPLDLETICLKCLEKIPERRYATARELADELDRFLAHQPIRARPVGLAGKLGRWARRRPAVASLAAALILSLLGGFGAVLRQLGKTELARGEAQTAATTSREVTQFLKEMLKGVGPARARGRDTVMLIEILNDTARSVTARLTGQPAVEGEIRDTLGLIYLDLGDYAKAEAMLRAGLTARRQAFGPEHPDVASSLLNLATVLGSEGRLAEAESFHREALNMQRKLLGPVHLDVARSLNNLAWVLERRGRSTEVEPLLQESLSIRRQLLGGKHPDLAPVLSQLAGLLKQSGQFREAEAMQREALTIVKAARGADHPDVAIALRGVASVLLVQNRRPEAETLMREALALQRRVLGLEHPDVAESLDGLAQVLSESEKLDEAETFAREAVRQARKFLGPDHDGVAKSLGTLGSVLIRKRDYAQAEPVLRESLSLLQSRFEGAHPRVSAALNALGAALYHLNKPDEAAAVLREAANMAKSLPGDHQLMIAEIVTTLAGALGRLDRWAEAESCYREALAVRDAKLGEHLKVALSLSNLGYALGRQKNYVEGETCYRRSLAMCEELLGPEHSQTGVARGSLVAMLERQGKAAEAERVRASAPPGANRERPDRDIALAASERARSLLERREFSAALTQAEAALRGFTQLSTNYWRTFDARSLLGGCLLGLGKMSDAEPNLIAGYEGLRDRAATISPGNESRLREALARLVQYYQAASDRGNAAAWEQKLAEWDQSHAPPTTPVP